MKWKTIASYPWYEMSDGGAVRTHLSHVPVQPLFIGPHGVLGFLLKRGMSSYLAPLHELYAETWPE